MLEKDQQTQSSSRFYLLKKKAYSLFVSFFTALYALKASIVAVVAVSALPFLASISLPSLIPLLVFVFSVEFVICIYLHRQALSDTLQAIFVTGIFNKASEYSASSQEMVELGITENISPISNENSNEHKAKNPTLTEFTPKQKAWMIIGIICTTATSLAIASFSYLSVIHLIGIIATFFSISVLPPVAITIAISLAVIGFVVFGALLLDKIHHAIAEDAHHKVIHFFLDLIPHANGEKPLAQQWLESIFKLFFLLLALGLGLLALIVTLGTLNKKLFTLFFLIPAADEMACKIASGIIVYGLAGLAKLPWIMQSLGRIAATIGEAIGYGLFFLCRKIAYLFCQPAIIPINNVVKNESKNAIAWKQLSHTEKLYFIFEKVAKISIVLFSGFIATARATQGGSETFEDICTTLAPSGDAQLIENIAHVTALSSAATFHLCIGGYAVFFPKEKKPQPLSEEPLPKVLPEVLC